MCRVYIRERWCSALTVNAITFGSSRLPVSVSRSSPESRTGSCCQVAAARGCQRVQFLGPRESCYQSPADRSHAGVREELDQRTLEAGADRRGWARAELSQFSRSTGGDACSIKVSSDARKPHLGPLCHPTRLGERPSHAATPSAGSRQGQRGTPTAVCSASIVQPTQRSNLRPRG